MTPMHMPIIAPVEMLLLVGWVDGESVEMEEAKLGLLVDWGVDFGVEVLDLDIAVPVICSNVDVRRVISCKIRFQA